jgi:hypothetical protein
MWISVHFCEVYFCFDWIHFVTMLPSLYNYAFYDSFLTDYSIEILYTKENSINGSKLECSLSNSLGMI